MSEIEGRDSAGPRRFTLPIAVAEPHGETGGDDGVGWIGQAICVYPYVPLTKGKVKLIPGEKVFSDIRKKYQR